MTDSSPEGRTNTAKKQSQISVILSRFGKKGTIYVSAAALALGAFVGAASFEPNPARAFAQGENVSQGEGMRQKLPSFAPLVKQVKPAVVSIRVKSDAAAKAAFGDDEGGPRGNPFEGSPLERYFGGPGGPRGGFGPWGRAPGGKGGPRQLVTAQGSGFFISPDGYLVTNNHVAQDAVSLEVVMDDGKIYTAKVVGTDPRTDLALLKVDGRNDFPYTKFSHSGAEIGDWVVAMGNPFGLGGTVTAGIVSARGRDIGEGPYDDFIQIDASVNKGNSGGPTFNESGEVIGVNTAIYSPSGGSVGIAFAIPAPTVERVVAALKDKGHVTRGWLGVQIQGLTPELADSLGLKTTAGALVAAPQSGSPAEKAGIKTGDVITQVDGTEVKDGRDLAKKIADIAPGANAKLTVLRDGETKTVDLKIGQLPEKPTQRASLSDDGRTGLNDLGIAVAPAADVSPNDRQGLAVVGVEPGGKAAEAGLAEGDIILRVGDQTVNRPGDLKRALTEASKSGKKNALALVKRNGDQRFVALPAVS
ncbi:Do family serine endopeptidase [Rhodomicrobium vannielii ATCC 17100]|uniref:Do family serine endopeptidase n=1 Tax=Rhodomicrobium vannielii TaxID=1069 RepID=UPI001918CB5D|nr:Do family serine endopeptidase [Rhodomicrobium vannielii]MBJ7532612.1 Do family serine endopeptidase [Rhodomicrobium vannielii ATCC 17100]